MGCNQSAFVVTSSLPSHSSRSHRRRWRSTGLYGGRSRSESPPLRARLTTSSHEPSILFLAFEVRPEPNTKSISPSFEFDGQAPTMSVPSAAEDIAWSEAHP
jgi:hypothetical protein